MRFSDDVADIPDRLVSLQERGEVVFLCGAGISQRYDLPSFYKLTKDIYAHLGESWIGHPAEEDAMGVREGVADQAPAALDRALFALSKRLRGTDTASRLRAERMLTEAIEANLQPPEGPFEAHADVWTLSRDPEMRQRIVTTNFDTLFERSGPAGVASRSGADLPPPLGTDFTGALHLHGRIADETLGLGRTPLVLNSAEFGEAYLRSGWAARYVYDLARATTIVILGYGADDPPMRYILEVLTADRERYPDIREIFAFVPCSPHEAGRARTSTIWEAKGATAILYDSGAPSDHDALYRTIGEWARFAADPTGWRRQAAARILALDPETVEEGDWTRLRWLLGGGDADELLAEINPEPHWAAPLSKAGILTAEGVSPYRWILKRLNDRKMPAAIAENVPVSRGTMLGLERALTWRNRSGEDLHPILLQAWRLIAQVAARHLSDGVDGGLRWFRSMSAVKEGDFSLATKRDILECLRPKLEIGRIFHWPGLELGADETDLRLRRVLALDWGPKGLDKIDSLVASWPAATRLDLLHALERQLYDALEEAADTGTLYATSSDVRSVSAHTQDIHADGFYSIVRALIDLWDIEVSHNGESAKKLAQAWLQSDYLLLRRMGLHALRQPCFTSTEVASALLALSEDDFWLGGARREIMQLFVHRWPTVGPDDRTKVEARIVAGMPRELLRPDGPADQIASIRDNAVFIRLSRIKDVGHSLSAAGRDALQTLQKAHPDWRPEGERDEFTIWTSGLKSSRREGDLSVLEGLQPDQILARVEEVSAGNPLEQADLWRLFCDAAPAEALAALLATDPRSDVKPGAWQSYFWSLTASENDEMLLPTFETLEADGFAMGPFVGISEWLVRKHGRLSVAAERLLSVWDVLFDTVARHGEPVDDQSRNDPTFSMLNSAEGNLGAILLDAFDKDREDDAHARHAILSRIERLIAAEGKLGFLGAAAIAEGLPALFSEERVWTEENLIPLTRWDSPAATAVWSVLLRRKVPRPDLYAALKPAMLEAGQRQDLDRAIERLSHWLLAPLLWAQQPTSPPPEISPVEVRRALGQAIERVRSSAAYWLAGAIDDLSGTGAELWRTRIGPLFRQVWPLEPGRRSSAASVHLLRLVLKTGDAFAEAAETIAPALGPIDTWEIESYLGLDEDAAPFYTSAPSAMLTLFDAVVSEQNVPGTLLAMLERIAAADPALESDRRFQKLLGWARRQASH